MQKTLVLAAATLAFGGAVLAQGTPRGTAAISLAGKKVQVEYGRPALKGRSLEALLKDLPADRMWRAGSEQVTTFSTEADLLVGGKKVPAGKYSLYLHAPATGDYALAINKDLGVPLGKIWDKAPAHLKDAPWPHLEDYQKNVGAQEVARVTLKKAAVEAPVDQFTIALSGAGDSAVLSLAWGSSAWSTDVKAATK